MGQADASNRLPRLTAECNEMCCRIATAKQRAVQAVDGTLSGLDWRVGENSSHKMAAAEWGDGVVNQLAAHLARTQPGLRGFTRPNLFRMRPFYEAYRDDEKVTPLLRQLPWTHKLILLTKGQSRQQRAFYMRTDIHAQGNTQERARKVKRD